MTGWAFLAHPRKTVTPARLGCDPGAGGWEKIWQGVRRPVLETTNSSAPAPSGNLLTGAEAKFAGITCLLTRPNNGNGADLVSLVERARRGDINAFEALYRECQAGVYSFIRGQVGKADLAADLTQQTFIKAWESLPRLREAGAFLGWLHRIAANLVKDEVKSGHARLEVAASEMPDNPIMIRSSSPGPEATLADEELRAAVWAALGELSAEQRATVVMHHMEGMSVAEIAQAAGVRPGTVMSRLARAREALRKRLSAFVEDCNADL